MKRKALLLIIPFAAAGLAGCQQANPNPPAPQCDSATVSITSAGGVTVIKPGETLQLTAQTNIEGCSFSWDSKDKSVATVDSNGEVTAIKVGQTTIKYGPGEFILTVDNNPPAPQKEVVEVLSVKSHPESVVVGGSISPSSVILNVKFNDGSSGEKAATDVECDTSTAGNAVEAKAYYNDLGPVTFEIKVIAQGQTTHAGTEADPYDSADAASVASALAEGGVTPKSYYIKGVVEKLEENFSSQYGNYSFNIGNNFICWRLKNGSSKANFNEGDIEIGDEVVVYAQIQKFHQDAQGDKPARNLLETKDGYVVSVKKGSAEKEVEALVSAAGPSQVTVGTQIKPADVNITVRFTDQSTGTVKATRVVCDTSAAGDAIQGQAYYNDLGPVSFTVKVVAQSETTHAGTEADPYDSADAASVASALAEGGVTQQSYYIKGTVEKFEETFSSQFGNYSFNIGNNFICWRLKNGSSKANFNEGDIEIGDEVVVYAQIQKFHQDAQGDKPARNLLETKDGYVVSVNKGGEQKEVTGITAVSYTKTLYVGGTINPTDVTLTVSYSDSSSGSVKAQSVDGYSTEEAGNTTATAHYGTFTKDFVVEVKTKPAPSGNSYNLIKSNDDVTEGQYLIVYGSKSFSGVDTTANYATVDVSDESIEDSDELVYVKFEKMSGGYAIKVVGGDNDEKYIYGQSGQNKLLFDTNKKLNTISVDNDGKATIVSETSILKFNTNTGTSDDRFRYYKSANTDEKMVLPSLYKLGTPTPQKTITGVELQGTLEKSSYIEGQTFDPSGLSLKVTYNEGDPDILTSGFTFNVTNTLVVGEYDLKATYEGHTTEGFVHISVVAKELVSIAITHGMNQTTYQDGSDWNAEGIVVQGTYNDGDIQTISSANYELSYSPEKATGSGSVSVNIVATMSDGSGIKSEAFPQTVTVQEDPVTEPVLVDISIEGSLTKSDYKVGETYSAAGLSVLGHYDNESTKPLDVAITFNKTVAAFGDTAIIASVEYEDLSDEKEFTVTVAKVDENVIDVSSVNSYTITPDGEGLPSSYGEGSNTNFAWTGLYKGQNNCIQGNSSKSSELHNVRAFSKEITYIKFNVGYAAGDASTGEVRFGSSAQPTGNAGKYGADTDNSLTEVGSFVLFAPSASTYLSVVWTKGASYFSSIDVHFDEYNEEGSAVDSVSLNKDSITLEAGSSETLVPTIAPSDAANKQVTWESSNEDVATVDSTGKVTAVAEGTATITVTTKDGGKTDTCSVTVTKASEGGSIAIDLGGDASVVFGGVTYEKSLKAGTGKVAGSTTINVPSGAKKLVFYAAGWNGETVEISVSGGGISKTLSLTSDSGVSGNGPYTIGSTTESNFKFEIDVSSLTGATTLTLAATSGKRFVVWNASYTK